MIQDSDNLIFIDMKGKRPQSFVMLRWIIDYIMD